MTERDFLADEECMYILSHILGVGTGVITKTDMWTNTLADNMTTCEKYFAYCGAGIYIPIQHIRLGDKKALEESYLKDKEPKKDTKNGRG